MSDKLQLQPGEIIARQGDGWYFIVFVEKQIARYHIDKDAFVMRKEGKYIWFTRNRDQCQFLLHANTLLEVTKVIPPSTETIAAAELAGEEYPGDFLMLKSTVNEEEYLFNKTTLYKVEKVPCGGEEHCPQCRANAQHKRDEAKKAAEAEGVPKVEVVDEPDDDLEPGEIRPKAPVDDLEPGEIRPKAPVDDLEPGEIRPKAPKKTTRAKVVKKVDSDDELEPGEIRPKAPKKTTRTKVVKNVDDELEPGEIRPKAPKKTTRAKVVEEELEEGEIPKAPKKPGAKKTK